MVIQIKEFWSISVATRYAEFEALFEALCCAAVLSLYMLQAYSETRHYA